MGITLTYKPSPQPSPDAMSAMVKEASAVRPLQEWWSEPLNLLNAPSLGVIGMTKVSLPGYSGPDGSYVEIGQSEDFLMMWSDISCIVRVLSQWAKKYELQWVLQLEGEPLGSIESSGAVSAEVGASLLQLLQMAGAPEDPVAREALVSSISKKYESRWK